LAFKTTATMFGIGISKLKYWNNSKSDKT